jgi:hypothetical protein
MTLMRKASQLPHQDERRSFEQYKAAVTAREAAQQELLDLYRQRAEGVTRGEPQRHWLH